VGASRLSVPPEQFSAVEQGYLAIALAWPDSTVDEEGYTLERSTDGGQHWQAIAELDANTLRYVDYGLARYTRYDYRLTAHNSQGGSQVQTAQAQTGGTGQFTTESRSVAITYGYDPLNRLTAADYSDGSYYHYAYDANGNRLTQDISGSISNTYDYDIADRLTSVDGVAYT
jgi:YD repeat-containing protein